MNRTLYLLRHAKSSWSDSALSDFDRPLNKRGKKAREHMARYIVQNGHIPDLIICSTARRAVMTLKALRPMVGSACRIVMDEGLYMADPKGLANRIENIDKDIASVMLIGHNPGFQMLALSLAEPSSRTEYDRLQFKFPTAALCILEIDQSTWGPLAPRSFQLSDFVLPRELSEL
jgi:phosphohistidine phosphatase